MGVKSKKTPYEGLAFFLPVLCLPSVCITLILYLVIARWQPQFGQALNLATAKTIGFGAGVLFHFSCWIAGAFTQDFRAVKKRVGEFFSNIVISARLAFSCYLEDVKMLGLCFWIDFAVVALNAVIFVVSLLDYLSLREMFL